MHAVVTNETALRAEIEELRKRYTDTKDLYREVAILLFFRHGQTPTTNRLYQLVRKGSMNTVTAALSAFWGTLRERSRVQIDHPAIPDELKAAAGDLVQVLWEKANVAAKAEFEAAGADAGAEANAKVVMAQQSQRQAELALDQAQREQLALDDRLKLKTEEQAATLTAIQTEKREHGATTARLEETRAEVESLRQALGDARRDFAAELDKARAAMTLAEERLDAAERRALLEIDRERTLKGKAEEETARLRTSLATAEEKSNIRAQADAAELGQLRGKLQSIEADLSKRETDLAGMRKEISTLESSIARRDGEVVAARAHAANMENALRAYAKFAEHGHATVHMALQAYQSVCAQWKLTNAEMLTLLGATSAKQLVDWTQSVQPIPDEINERIIAAISIHRYLHMIFSDAAIADEWIRKKNSGELFDGRCAIDLMLKPDGLGLVRQYLAAQAAGN
jgi:hypothetical protein